MDQDSAWVETVDDLDLAGRRQALPVDQRAGRLEPRLPRCPADGADVRLLTPGAFDVLGVSSVDAKRAAGSTSSPRRTTRPAVPLPGAAGRHRAAGASHPRGAAGVARVRHRRPDAAYALHNWSSFGTPRTTDLVALPSHQSLRVLVANTQLKERVAALRTGPAEFFSGGHRRRGVAQRLDHEAAGVRPEAQVPGALLRVRRTRASQTVMDSWGGSTWLWHAMLTQQGYLVASVDNRGTGARGRDFRKVIYGQMGVIETQDQAAAARAIGRWGLRGLHPDGHLGLELRRLHDPQHPLPGQRRVPHGSRRGPGDPLEVSTTTSTPSGTTACRRRTRPGTSAARR